MKHQVDFLELLQIDYEKYPVIAVVGGGGKTSLIYRLTDELIDKGKRVIITTTTHMAGESELPFARGGDAVRVKELLEKELNIKVLGYVPKMDDCVIESRHLGLVLPDEIPELKRKPSPTG